MLSQSVISLFVYGMELHVAMQPNDAEMHPFKIYVDVHASLRMTKVKHSVDDGTDVTGDERFYDTGAEDEGVAGQASS